MIQVDPAFEHVFCLIFVYQVTSHKLIRAIIDLHISGSQWGIPITVLLEQARVQQWLLYQDSLAVRQGFPPEEVLLRFLCFARF